MAILRRGTLCLLALCGLLLAAPARGQSFRDEIAPALSREDYRMIATRLALAKEEEDAAGRLYEGYLAEHERAVAVFKKAFKDLRKGGREVDGEWINDPEAERVYGEAVKRWSAAKPGLQAAFLKDLRGMIDGPEAAARWEGVERLVRRQLLKSISSRGAVSWHRVDLIRGVALLELKPEVLATVQSLLDEYELLVERPLLRMEPVREVEDDDGRRTWNDGVRELGAINRRFLRLIMQELSPEPAARLNQWARDQAYWHMAGWDSSTIRRGYDEAKRLATLTDEQRIKADRLIIAIDKRWAALRTQAEADYDAADEKMLLMSDREWTEANARGESPLFVVTSRWVEPCDEVYLGAIAGLEGILTEEQRKKVWPPHGSYREALIERSRKVFE